MKREIISCHWRQMVLTHSTCSHERQSWFPVKLIKLKSCFISEVEVKTSCQVKDSFPGLAASVVLHIFLFHLFLLGHAVHQTPINKTSIEEVNVFFSFLYITKILNYLQFIYIAPTHSKCCLRALNKNIYLHYKMPMTKRSVRKPTDCVTSSSCPSLTS